ncbi:unnamed protein product [Miscanthus lutarioriparius]|uniref:DUF1639 family protein n=1 Tax=Miscanthus lutarioriparius TaxID=422564 RepID=A0A811RN09_9POAL|nr:unnamed protein product [Miscanthus lutarioriparius]
MRGSADAVAVARDMASSSPSKPASALDMLRYPRPSSDGLPLPNGIGTGTGTGSSGASKKPAAPAPAPAPLAPRSSKDDVAPPAVATDSSRLAAFLATTSLEPKPRARAPPAQAAPTSAPTTAAVSVVTKSPARDHGHGNGQHPSSDHSDPASPRSTGAGELLLQWGQNKRMRCRRDSASASPQRGQAGGGKIQRRSSSPAADKLMPPPSAAPYTRASNLRSASPLHPRSRSGSGSSGGASDAHQPRPHPSRSAEDRGAGAAGRFSAAARAEKQRAVSPHKVGPGSVMGLGVPDPKPQQQYNHNQGGSGSGSGHQHQQAGAAAAASTKPAPKLEVPRIYTTLSRKEKEDDFMAMKGTKLPQRPKRRPKNVEKTINAICPGMWLTDVTRSRYEVREKKCPKKQQKNRGLKGMESMDSDSD